MLASHHSRHEPQQYFSDFLKGLVRDIIDKLLDRDGHDKRGNSKHQAYYASHMTQSLPHVVRVRPELSIEVDLISSLHGENKGEEERK